MDARALGRSQGVATAAVMRGADKEDKTAA